MTYTSRLRAILSVDGLKSLVTSGGGAAAAEQERLAKVISQRDDARNQRDKAREQRERLQGEVEELKLYIENLEELRDVENEVRQVLAEPHMPANSIDADVASDDPGRYASLLKRELLAESKRVQTLERNLDVVLRRTSELESRLARARAMLAAAIDGGVDGEGGVDLAAVKTELASSPPASLAAPARASAASRPPLLAAPTAAAGDAATARPAYPDSAATTPYASDDAGSPTGQAPAVADDARGEQAAVEQGASLPEPREESDGGPDVVDDARPAPGSSAAFVASTPGEGASGGAPAPAPAARDVTARLPTPAVLKGKLLTPDRAAKVAEERQAQIDEFLAGGEYARIQALRNIHQGRRAFIVGNGPSLMRQDLSKLDGEITFVANWFANHDGFDQMKPRYYAISSHEMFGGWAHPNPVLNDRFVEKLTRHSHKPEMFFSHRFKGALGRDPAMTGYERRYLIFDRPKFLADEVGGLEFDLAQPMHDGYTVLLTFCVPLAVHMGITEIYMVGCDCDYAIQQDSDARAYFYPPAEHATSSTKAENINRIWGENGPLFRTYELTREACAARGVRMFNATAGGRLEVLPRADYDEVLSVRSMAAGA